MLPNRRPRPRNADRPTRGNLVNCILAAMMGRDSVRVGDILPYLHRRIDPSRAVSRLLSERNRRKYGLEGIGLQDQIELGKQLIVGETLRHMRKYVSYGDQRFSPHSQFTSEEVWANIIITLNERGKQAQQNPSVWRELQHALTQGFLTIRVGITDNIGVVLGDAIKPPPPLSPIPISPAIEPPTEPSKEG